MTVDDLLAPGATPEPTPETLGMLLHEVRALRADLQAEGMGALGFIAALTHKAGGRVELTDKELTYALNLGLERAERPDGGLIIKTVLPEDMPQEIITERAVTLALPN